MSEHDNGRMYQELDNQKIDQKKSKTKIYVQNPHPKKNNAYDEDFNSKISTNHRPSYSISNTSNNTNNNRMSNNSAANNANNVNNRLSNQSTSSRLTNTNNRGTQHTKQQQQSEATNTDRYINEDDSENSSIYKSELKPQHSYVPPAPSLPTIPPPSITHSLPHQIPPPLPNSFLNSHTHVSPAASFSLSDNVSESNILYAVQPQASLAGSSVRQISVIDMHKSDLGHSEAALPRQEPPLYEDEHEENSEHIHTEAAGGENNNVQEVVYVGSNGSESGMNHKQTSVLY